MWYRLYNGICLLRKKRFIRQQYICQYLQRINIKVSNMCKIVENVCRLTCQRVLYRSSCREVCSPLVCIVGTPLQPVRRLLLFLVLHSKARLIYMKRIINHLYLSLPCSRKEARPDRPQRGTRSSTVYIASTPKTAEALSRVRPNPKLELRNTAIILMCFI